MIIRQPNQIVTSSSPNKIKTPVDLQLNLFGSFSAKNRQGQEIAFRDDKVRALLAYLVVERDRSHRRESLAEIFWGQSPEPRARQSLRMALTRLRKSLSGVIAETYEKPPFLDISRQSVQVHPKMELQDIDIVEFEHLVAKCEANQVTSLDDAPFLRDWMSKAVTLYQGNFLAGFTLTDSPRFDDWLLMMQGRYEQQVLSFLHTLTEDALDHKWIQKAERYAQRQLEILPWLETAHRQLMRLYAQRGLRQLIDQQYQSCVHILETELGTHPEPETEKLLEQIKLGQTKFKQTTVVSQPGVAAEVPNNLPRRYTPFFGREVERGKLIRALLDERYSLITIVGPGGVGKTRLSMDMSRHILHQPAFEDGVWFVPLDGLRGEDENLYESIATTMAAILDVELVHPTNPHEQLFEYLQSKKLLLILDNFEQLIADAGDGVDFVLDLLQRATQIKIVVSSRRPLDTQLETVITLDGLPVPENVEESAYTYSSVQLFAERAKRVNQQFVLDKGTLPNVVKICQMMAGTPLGLELVAVRLREMNLKQIIQALNTNLDLLKTQLRDLPTRHRSLRAVFNWSWALLSDDEKRVVSELSVFRGSFNLEAVRAVTGAEPDLVYALISHSLIRADGGRYSLHELLRQYAAEKLDHVEQVQAKHSEFYLRFVQKQADSLIRKNLAEITREIQKDWENIHQAWNSAIESQNINHLNLAITGLGHYLRNSGMLWIGTKLFEAAIEHLEKEWTEKKTSYWEHTLGQLKLELARSLFWSAKYKVCISNAQQVLEIGGNLQENTLIAGGRLEMGRAYWRLGEYDQACNSLEQALAMEPDDPWLTVQVLNSLGNTYSVWGRLNQATGYYQNALELQKANDIWSNRVQVLNNLAANFAMKGLFEEAISLLYEVLDTSKHFNQQYYQVTIYHNLGLVHCETGEFSRSKENFERALNLSHQLQNRQIEAEIWLGLAQYCRRLGQLERSEEHIHKAISLCDQFGDKKSKSEALVHQTLFHYVQEQYEAALKNSNQSIQLATDFGPTEIDVDMMLVNGHCHLALTHLEEAKSAYQLALNAVGDFGNRPKETEALLGLAQVNLRLNRQSHASQLIEKVWRFYQDRRTFVGAVLPYHLYLKFYSSFIELNDPRAAIILKDAQRSIRIQAETISDPKVRQIFLNQPVCQQLLCL